MRGATRAEFRPGRKGPALLPERGARERGDGHQLYACRAACFARLWAAGSEMQPRRSGGRQRRAARWRGRRVRECYVGAVQAAERFEERAEMHGWFTSDGSGSDSDYYSAVED